MFEKLVLAATITFSLNLCLHLNGTGGQRAELEPPENTETEQTILVRLPNYNYLRLFERKDED